MCSAQFYKTEDCDLVLNCCADDVVCVKIEIKANLKER